MPSQEFGYNPLPGAPKWSLEGFMEQIDTQALENKLLYFAGLHRNEPTGGFWWDEEGNEVFDFHNPNEKGFTHSLDACFKWLVPKLEGLQQIILQLDEGRRWYLGMTVDDKLYENIGFCPALALCLAIEKLINEKAKE